jgi:hypothetical protein
VPSRVALTILGIVVAATAFAQSIDAPIDRYRGATGVGKLGAVRGRAFEERRLSSSSDAPLGGTVVTLVPRSDAWLSRLEAIKRGSRGSVEAYRDAAPAVRRSWEAYEKVLWEAGAGDLSQTVTVDGEGVFAFDKVPAGPWILLASRATYVNKTPQARTPPGLPGGAPRPAPPPSPFLPIDKLAGYHSVAYWVREVVVAPGAVEAIELTDRNIWLSGVVENRQPPPLPDRPFEPPR